MKTSTRTRTRLVLVLLVLTLGLVAGPAEAWADDRPAPAFGAAAQDGSFSRPAPAYGRAAQNPVDPGESFSRPAPADNIGARTPEASPAPVATVPVSGFDWADAGIGAAVALALALLLVGGTRLARGHGRLAHR